MNVEANQIRAYRLAAHHLDQKIPPEALIAAVGACGLQNSPPGAWETALFNRVAGCTREALRRALYEEKRLLQAWSFRGAPVVFPAAQSGAFLTALMARAGEWPWIYTRGIEAALSYVDMPFDDLLARTMKAALYLDNHVVLSKEALDRTLAQIVEADLPGEKLALWRAPSMYGRPDRQTVGGAVVSFMLRPCAFASLVVFGERQGASPTFTSYKNWLGRAPEPAPDAEGALARGFLHGYGPATTSDFMAWLGCSRRQAARLWSAIAAEIEPVNVAGKTRYILACDRERLLHAGDGGDALALLGAHDPYLDVQDKGVLLADAALQKMVWKTVANPGVILRGGRVAGIWRSKTQGGRLDVSMTPFEPLGVAQKKTLENLAGAYAAFCALAPGKCQID